MERLLCRWLPTDKAWIDGELVAAAQHIYPPDHIRSPQQWESVVPQLPFRRRRVRFEAVGPAPKVFESPTIPNQRIEGCEKTNHICRFAALQPAAGPHIAPPVGHGAFQ